MSIVTIVDRQGAAAFKINTQAKTYEFSHDILEAMIKRGIYIPPYCRPLFNNKAVISPPKDSDTSAEYELFKDAVLLLHSSELIKSGFKAVTEEPKESKK